MEEEGILPLETSIDVFLYFNFTTPEQEYIMFQSDVGVDDNDESTTSKIQAGAREEFARLPIGRQQRETASIEQSKQFDRGRSTVKPLLFWKEECLVAYTVCLLVFFLVCCLLSTVVFFLSCPQFSEAGTEGDWSDWDVPDTWTAVPGHERSSSRFSSTKGILCVPLCFLVAY